MSASPPNSEAAMTQIGELPSFGFVKNMSIFFFNATASPGSIRSPRLQSQSLDIFNFSSFAAHLTMFPSYPPHSCAIVALLCILDTTDILSSLGLSYFPAPNLANSILLFNWSLPTSYKQLPFAKLGIPGLRFTP